MRESKKEEKTAKRKGVGEEMMTRIKKRNETKGDKGDPE
jgi:hypothetical protein